MYTDVYKQIGMVNIMGYLVCDACGGYYELQEGEKPEDFSDECECGGKLHYTEFIEEPEEEYEGHNESMTCPNCGSENPGDASICVKCNESMIVEPGDDTLGHLYKDEQLLTKKKKTIQEYGTGLKAKSKRKELKIASDVQEILDIRGSYLVKGKDDTSIKILNKGLETDNERFIGFENIIRAEIDEEILQDKSKLSRLVATGTSLFDHSKSSLKIILQDGEILLENVKKDDAQKLVYFVNRKIQNP